LVERIDVAQTGPHLRLSLNNALAAGTSLEELLADFP